MIPAWWSVLLTTVGVTALWLAGRRGWLGSTGWAIGLAGQALWAAYAIASRQWGFLGSAAVYGAVYALNLRRSWRRDTARSGASSHGSPDTASGGPSSGPPT